MDQHHPALPVDQPAAFAAQLWHGRRASRRHKSGAGLLTVRGHQEASAEQSDEEETWQEPQT